MPRAWIYCRVSTERQAAQGDSLDAQEANARRAFEYEYEPKGFVLGGTYRDAAESGGKRLVNRTNGCKLNLELERGDVVIFPKLDRGFRNTEDMLATVRVWRERGISVRMLDLSIDTATDVGMFVLTCMAAAAEFERKRIAQRIKDMWAHRRQQRLDTGDTRIITHGLPPYGFKSVAVHGKKRWVKDDYMRAIGAKIVEWHEVNGMSFNEIWLHLRKSKIKRLDHKGREQEWSHLRTVHKYYWEEKRLQAEEEAKGASSATCTSTGTSSASP